MTRPDSRYRTDGEFTCIDLHVHRVEQLFDGRDPAPFLERDLDEDASTYLYDAATDIPRDRSLKIVITVGHELDPLGGPATIEAAVRAHFQHAAEQVGRQLRSQRQFGRVALAGGLTVLVLLLALAEAVRERLPGHWDEVVQTGLVIMGWVALWKPIEVLLYDWWPLVQQRKELQRVAAARIDVRGGPA
jgi:hypothetical protein